MSQPKLPFLGQFKSYKPMNKIPGQANSGEGSPGLICPPNSLFLLVRQGKKEEYKFETLWLADDRGPAW